MRATRREFSTKRAHSMKWNCQKLFSFGFAAKELAIGLQMADFLAVTSRKYIGSYGKEAGYASEPQIVSILRDRFYLIDQTAISFFPTPQKKKSS